MTQSEVAQRIGVQLSYVGLIEGGKRKPSIKLVARIADALGVDRQELLVLAHPEAEVLLAEPPSEASWKTALSWQQFINDRALLARYHVTKRELEALEYLKMLTTALSAKDFIAILMLVRDIPEPK